MSNSNNDKWNEESRALYLKNLAETGLHYASCRVAGVCAATVYKARREDKEFLEACEEAMRVFREDVIEKEIKRRATEGVPELVIQGGKVVTQFNATTEKFEPVFKYVLSDRMLELYAKRHIPEYREKGSLEISAPGGVLVVPGGLTDEQWEQLYRHKREQAQEVSSGDGAS